jgi:hypothetical protein
MKRFLIVMIILMLTNVPCEAANLEWIERWDLYGILMYTWDGTPGFNRGRLWDEPDLVGYRSNLTEPIFQPGKIAEHAIMGALSAQAKMIAYVTVRNNKPVLVVAEYNYYARSLGEELWSYEMAVAPVWDCVWAGGLSSGEERPEGLFFCVLEHCDPPVDDLNFIAASKGIFYVDVDTWTVKQITNKRDVPNSVYGIGAYRDASESVLAFTRMENDLSRWIYISRIDGSAQIKMMRGNGATIDPDSFYGINMMIAGDGHSVAWVSIDYKDSFDSFEQKRQWPQAYNIADDAIYMLMQLPDQPLVEIECTYLEYVYIVSVPEPKDIFGPRTMHNVKWVPRVIDLSEAKIGIMKFFRSGQYKDWSKPFRTDLYGDPIDIESIRYINVPVCMQYPIGYYGDDMSIVSNVDRCMVFSMEHKGVIH